MQTKTNNFGSLPCRERFPTDKKMLDSWQRIEKVVNWTGLSVNAFARCIGLKRAENLYQIKKGNHGISKELAEMITTKYTTVSKSWLLTGTGNMFLDEGHTPASSIPYYRVDVIRLLMSQDFFSPSSFFSVPLFNGCELAALNTGNAMKPDIPYGAVIFIKKAEPQTIMPGNIYVVISPAFSGIRYVRREPGSSELRLVPRNKDEYDDVIIDVADLQRLYEVRGYLVVK